MILPLYLYVQLSTQHDAYPIGHSEITVSDFREAKEYFSIIKCVVEAPPQDIFPALPTTSNEKLVFTLCQKCATDQVRTSCPQVGADRCLDGTWCTPELHFAMEHGYKVFKIPEVWHWQEKRLQIFARFADKFPRIKTEAAGWSNWCTDDIKTQQFISQVYELVGLICCCK